MPLRIFFIYVYAKRIYGGCVSPVPSTLSALYIMREVRKTGEELHNGAPFSKNNFVSY